ncbi:MAG: helix-turn-helix transcriptional regulator [Pelistega sp.]|nr:helix-turn-helix transcriptional regulator [Pelistega sp.]
MNKIQFINDSAGQAEYVVMPVAEYKRLVALEDELEFQDIAYHADEHDDVTIPHEVVNLMLDQDVSLLAAWRIFRGMSQQEVAQITGLTQSSISQAEKKASKPQSKTCERLAAVYQCEPSQLIL